MKVFSRPALICSIFLLICASAKAFQFADATAPQPAPSGKYIFYWGQQQCDLTAEQQYKGRISLTPPAFRQMLLTAPKIWNGAGLVANFSFDLQQYKINTREYLTQIAALDQQFGQSASTGQLFSITSLDLGNGVLGHIDLELKEPEKVKKPIFGAQGYGPFLNERLLETIVWGQEEKFEISGRDFFTVSEFWQILGQEPYLEWRSWQEAQPVFAELQIIDAEEVTLSLRFYLEQQPYSDFIRQVRIYQHLIKPGIRATLLLQTSNQYERLYQKSLQLVDDGDERLRLRRSSDFHTMQFRWGTWQENIEGLYLKKNAGPQGKVVSADQPVNRWALAPLPIGDPTLWAEKVPEFLIDNVRIEGASYTLQVNDSTSYRVKNGQFDPAQVLQTFTEDQLTAHGWEIREIELAGYELPSINLSLRNNFFTRDHLKSQNELKILQKNTLPVAGYQIKAPALKQEKWVFEIESPQRTDLIISIFNAEKLNVYWEDIIVNAGNNSHGIPASAITAKGSYNAFVISSVGVAMIAFEIP